MSNKSFSLSAPLYEYLLEVSLREPQILTRLREETASDPMARMQIAPEQGQFMALLLQLIGARRVLEIGVFTGYSSLRMALALPPDAHMVCCDVSPEWTAIARRYWREAGVADRIELRLAPAIETLDVLLADGQADSYDFAFIDADKENYIDYYERTLQLLRPGGLVAIDNVLWSGAVVDASVQDEPTRAIRAFNKHLRDDRRVEASMLPLADGLTLAMKKTVI